MVLEYVVTMLVNEVCLFPFVLFPSVDWAPFAIPHAQTAGIHPFLLLLVASAQAAALLVSARVQLGGAREAVPRIVVDCVCRVRQLGMHVAESREVRRKGVAVPEENMLLVNLPDGVVYPDVEVDEAGLGRVCRFVQGVETGDPGVVLIVGRELLPQPHCAILEVLVYPEVGYVCTGVRMPVGVLASGCSMHIDDGVDPML